MKNKTIHIYRRLAADIQMLGGPDLSQLSNDELMHVIDEMLQGMWVDLKECSIDPTFNLPMFLKQQAE